METPESPKPNFKLYRWIVLGTFTVLSICCTLLVIVAATDLPPLTELENPEVNLSTQIYSADGKQIGYFYESENRIYVPLEEISPHAIDALIATEDIRFKNHNGVDPRTLGALVYRNLIKRQRSGGSTITMQLARNLYNKVGRERTAIRKVKEIIVSAVLEKNFTKDEIIQAYLNTSPMYGNTYGIEMASRTLYSKPAKDLEMHEAATLIGLLKGPTYYNPRAHPERCKERRNVVISQLKKYKFISAKQADSLKAMPLDLKYKAGGRVTRSENGYVKERIRQELKQWIKDQGGEYDLYTDGLKVHTTIDSRMQQYAEESVSEHLAMYQQTFEKELKRTGLPWVKNKQILDRAIRRTNRYYQLKKQGMDHEEIMKTFDEKRSMQIWSWSGAEDTLITPRDSVIHYLKFLETGFVAMDPENGHVKAWVGGINHDFFKYDHVSQGRRQVGSTFKPFVYATAIDAGKIEPCSKVLDIPYQIELPDGRIWEPKNSGGKMDGEMLCKDGLAESKNQVTAFVMGQLGSQGPEKVCNFVEKLGIKSEIDCVPSICLGTADLNVLEMVDAYCTFVNGGHYVKPMLITRIEDRHGNILAEFKPKKVEVLSPETSYSMVAMLMNGVDHLRGTGHSLRTKYGFENQMGGKTGTTQNHSDGWFMGITPNLVGGAWVGCAEREVRFPTIRYGQGARMALPIWAVFLQKVYDDRTIKMPKDPFEKPEGYRTNLNCEPPKKGDGGDDDDDDDLIWGPRE